MKRTYTANDFTLDLGQQYVWPGGYPRYFVCYDGEPLCFKCAAEHHDLIEHAISVDRNADWTVVGCDVNWEDDALRCAHCDARIECAYPQECS